MSVHWCGTGLSTTPGLRFLLEKGEDVIVWNRTIEKAQNAVADLTQNIRKFEQSTIAQNLKAGDLIISMLPGEWHVPLAELAISKRAHFISSSYISPQMHALNDASKRAQVTLMNEIGLDPGIDHLFAHKLINDYKSSEAYDPQNILSFTSYCGGIPKIANEFRYKFSWSPLGVLKALRSPSTSIKEFETYQVDRPWDAISSYCAPLSSPETFEVYPNRDSRPFIQQYGCDPDWKIKDFVRGTLRLKGWAKAWTPVFEEIETLSGPHGEKRLQEMSDQFWAENAYERGEVDRVVLCVSLKAQRNTTPIWHKTYAMDAWGDARGSAMARLVSNPVALAVQAILAGQIPAGVHAAPGHKDLIDPWLSDIQNLAQELNLVDHLSEPKHQ